MAEANYNYFEIDAADIWQFERNCFLEKRRAVNIETISDLYFSLQDYFLSANHTPTYIYNHNDKDQRVSNYFHRHIEQLKQWKAQRTPLDYFINKAAIYAMTEPCVIFFQGSDSRDFERLFAFKLRQYFDNLPLIKSFLRYQLFQNFNDNISRYEEFIKYLIIQQYELIDVRVSSFVKIFFGEIKSEIECEYTEQKSPVLYKLNASAGEAGATTGDVSSKETDTKEDDTKVPKGYKVVEGKFNKTEILHYFSFLYSELSVGGKPYLNKKNVKEIFKYGIAIPPKPLRKKYKLNISKVFPKKYIENTIYIFFTNNSKSRTDKLNYLRFFASYIEDFAGALKNEKALQNWNKNLSGEPSLKKSFDIDKYLPKPPQETSIESTPESTK